MTRLLRTFALVFDVRLRRVLRSRKSLAMLALAMVSVLPVLVVVPRRGLHDAGGALVGGVYSLILQVIVPLLGLLGASTAIAEEAADRTLVYPFSRPISRTGFLLGSFSAALVFVVGCSCTSVLALLLTILAFAPEARGLLAEVLLPCCFSVFLAGLSYTAVFVALGTKFRHPAIIGLGYTFAIEGLLANLPGKNQELTIQYHSRSLLADSLPASLGDFVRAGTELPQGAGESIAKLAMIAAGAILLGAICLERREDKGPAH